jgi:hypothetical protein
MQGIRYTLVAVAALGFAMSGPVAAQDKAKERAPVTRVLLENDKVRVVESTFRPGDVSRSDRKGRVAYYVKGGTTERTTKDGKKTVAERKTGTAVWLEADSDAVKNIGKANYVVVTTTLK